jgi:5-methylcytosine-specific restriction endonuclease McrA
MVLLFLVVWICLAFYFLFRGSSFGFRLMLFPFRLLTPRFWRSVLGTQPTRTAVPATTVAETTRQRREPIPRDVQMFVWQRDYGRCVQCGSNENLEYDHIIPVSRGGSSTARNVQLLCQRCNRRKGAKIG